MKTSIKHLTEQHEIFGPETPNDALLNQKRREKQEGVQTPKPTQKGKKGQSHPVTPP